MIVIILNILYILQLLLLAYFIISWFPLRSGGIFQQIWTILDRLFQPILTKLRSVLPRTGMIDLSGIVLFIGIVILQGILSNYV